MHAVLETSCASHSLITDPTIDVLSELWCSRLSMPEEVKYAFADASPGFDQFVKGVENKEILCVLAEDDRGDLVSASWLHDLERDYDGAPRVGWLGGYVFPGHRGAEAVHASNMMLDYFVDTGVHHIHTAIHVDNRKSQMFMRHRHMMAFTVVCRYPEWTTFGGQLSDALILTRHPRDTMLAWMCACKLASQRLFCQS